MATNNKRTWRDSSYKWKYLKIAFLTLSTPGNVYRIAHLNHSSTTREHIIRGYLLEYGILSNNVKNEVPDFDLENKHI